MESNVFQHKVKKLFFFLTKTLTERERVFLLALGTYSETPAYCDEHRRLTLRSNYPVVLHDGALGSPPLRK